MTTNTDPVRALADLAERAVPFLRDEAAKYDDDGSNEPLELAREIETALASLSSDESALPSANSAFDGGREAAPCPHAREVDCDCANPPVLASAPPRAPGLLADLETIWHSVSDDGETNAAYQRLQAALAQQVAAPAGWAIEVDGERVKVTRPDGGVNEWYARPGNTGSGMYDLCRALAQQPAAPSGEAVAEVTSDDDGDMLIRALRPIPHGTKLYAAPQQPAAVDEFAADRERLLRAFMMECGIIGAKEAGVNLARGIKAALAAQQQEPTT